MSDVVSSEVHGDSVPFFGRNWLEFGIRLLSLDVLVYQFPYMPLPSKHPELTSQWLLRH